MEAAACTNHCWLEEVAVQALHFLSGVFGATDWVCNACTMCAGRGKQAAPARQQQALGGISDGEGEGSEGAGAGTGGGAQRMQALAAILGKALADDEDMDAR